MFHLVDPESGFTSAVITEPKRFVGRQDLVTNSIRAMNAKNSLIAIFGKRGVGKSSLMRQIQLMSVGDFSLPQRAGLFHLVPDKPRTYYTVFYTCDSSIENTETLLRRLCTDSDPDDGLLRLVPDKGKQLQEFSRSSEEGIHLDLKLLNWGENGSNAKKYSNAITADIY